MLPFHYQLSQDPVAIASVSLLLETTNFLLPFLVLGQNNHHEQLRQVKPSHYHY